MAHRNARHVGKQDEGSCRCFRQSRDPGLQGAREAGPVVRVVDEGQVEVFECGLDLRGGMAGDDKDRASTRGERRFRDMTDQRLAEKRDDEFRLLRTALEARRKAGRQDDCSDLTHGRRAFV